MTQVASQKSASAFDAIPEFKARLILETEKQARAFVDWGIKKAEECAAAFAADKKFSPYFHAFVECHPKAAGGILRNNNLVNRKLSPAHVDKWRRMIEKEDILPAPSRVIFCDDKMLADAQHLLHGCVEAGKPFMVEWTFGVSRAIMRVIDSNLKARNNADTLQIANPDDAASFNIAKAKASEVLGFVFFDAITLNTVELQEVIDAYPEIEFNVNDGVRIGKRISAGRVKIKKGIQHAMTAAFTYIQNESHVLRTVEGANFLDDFKNQLEDGTGQTNKRSPVLVFRDAIVRDKISPDKIGREFEKDMMAAVVIVWNLWIKDKTGKRGKKLATIRDFTDYDSFPRPA